MVHPSCRSICYSFEPQTSSICVSSPRPKCLEHRCSNINWTGLTAYAYPPTALLHRVIQKIRQCHCLIIVIAPGWLGMPWFWDLVQLSTQIPLQLPVSTTLLKQSQNYVFHSNPQHLNLHTWCLGVDSSKNKASLWGWQRELLPLRGHQQEPSINQSGPYLRNGADKKFSGFFHSLCETSLRPFHVPVSRSKQVPLDHSYRTAIVDTLGPAGYHISQNSDLHRLLSSFHRIFPKVPGIFQNGTFMSCLMNSQKHPLRL